MFRTIALDFPKSVLIETCNKCQGECKFCPYQELRSHESLVYLELQKCFDLIDEISQHPVERLTLFNNNEPLLDKRIYQIVKYARQKMPNVEIGLSSNGRIITKRILDLLLDCGLTTLYISIPCVNEEDYEKVMGTKPNALFNVLESIEDDRLLEMVRIAVPITKYLNEDEMNQKFSKYKICTWNLEYKNSWGIQDKFFDVAKKDCIAGICDRPMDQIIISSNGNVLICCRDWQNQNVLGNVYNSTISEIWHSNAMRQIQELIAQEKYDQIECCKDCVMKREMHKR